MHHKLGLDDIPVNAIQDYFSRNFGFIKPYIKILMKKVSIPCAHCGSMFTVSIPTSGVSSMGHQHSPGCMKKTNVYVNNGDITKTTKA
jgi:hypothetical protein